MAKPDLRELQALIETIQTKKRAYEDAMNAYSAASGLVDSLGMELSKLKLEYSKLVSSYINI